MGPVGDFMDFGFQYLSRRQKMMEGKQLMVKKLWRAVGGFWGGGRPAFSLGIVAS